MEDRILAMCELSNDLLFHKIPRERLGYYVDASLEAGRSAAKCFSGRSIRELYEEYGEQIKKSADAAIQENIVEPVKEAVVEGTKSAIRDFFRDMGESIRSFFARLFS